MTGKAGPRLSSRIGFILATAGSAIGPGNIWRFPFVAGENGGGALLFPYVVAVLLLGLPGMIIEIRAGQSAVSLLETVVTALADTWNSAASPASSW